MLDESVRERIATSKAWDGSVGQYRWKLAREFEIRLETLVSERHAWIPSQGALIIGLRQQSSCVLRNRSRTNGSGKVRRLGTSFDLVNNILVADVGERVS